MNEVLYDKLVVLGADKLGSMLSELNAKNDGAAHYYKGGFQALKEVAFDLFGVDSADFRAQCSFIATVIRLDAQAAGRCPADEC